MRTEYLDILEALGTAWTTPLLRQPAVLWVLYARDVAAVYAPSLLLASLRQWAW